MSEEYSDWISLGEAAKLLGVHPTTVRNWADQGEIPFRRTPGRHRRFQRSALEHWASRKKDKEKTFPGGSHAQAIVEFALGHTRFSVNEETLKQYEWYEKMSPEAREHSRRYGRRLLQALLQHLEDAVPEEDELLEARTIGEEYGKFLKAEGLTLPQAVRGFVYFQGFLVESVIQMMAPTLTSAPSEWSDLFQQINAFTSEVLVNLITQYQSN